LRQFRYRDIPPHQEWQVAEVRTQPSSERQIGRPERIASFRPYRSFLRQYDDRSRKHFRTPSMPEGDEQQGGDEVLRAIAEKIRELARQTPIREAREELFHLADNLDRRADLAKRTAG
jgi:hypothetical protein